MRKVLVVVLAAVAMGCTKDEKPAAKPVVPTAPVMAPSAPTAQAAPAAPAAPGPEGLKGTVAERLDAPNYTYLRLTTAQGEAWAAVPTTTVAVGAEVVIANPMPMENFASKTLNRTFPLVYFGASADAPGAAPMAAAPHGDPGGQPAPQQPQLGGAMGGLMGGMGTGLAPKPAADLANVKTAKASGPDARTVAEIFAQKTALKDKPVTVRAKVVKVTTGVLGKNWLHVRDGSGAEGTNDLTVTTAGTVPNVGDTVLLTGTVALNKDFGMGYSYDVIVEDAEVTVEAASEM